MRAVRPGSEGIQTLMLDGLLAAGIAGTGDNEEIDRLAPFVEDLSLDRLPHPHHHLDRGIKSLDQTLCAQL